MMKALTVANASEIPSPALLLWRERIEHNLGRMLAMAGDPGRLRPHVKTHKLPQLVRRQIEAGIDRFKCATIAEAEMTAAAGGRDVLLAMQPVGPNARRYGALTEAFPQTQFSTIVDDRGAVLELAKLGVTRPIEVLVDLDIGQHRSGIEPGPHTMDLIRFIRATPGVVFGGLHAYDGHIHEVDPRARRVATEAAFAPVNALRSELVKHGIDVRRVVAGGTPTFPIHARRGEVECSPGTCLLWDAGYAMNLPDLDFRPAAFLLTRVISRPTPERVCLDLGHKAVASEMPHPRAVFLDLPDARPVAHNEEHLVVETSSAATWSVGDIVYAIPWHVCPTVALHAEAWVVENGVAQERWSVEARARRLTV
jgi:D-serine deaminase-like pyridoxal phosphate-dependent protein